MVYKSGQIFCCEPLLTVRYGFTRVGAWLKGKEQQRRLGSVMHKQNFLLILSSTLHDRSLWQINERCLCIIESTPCPLVNN